MENDKDSELGIKGEPGAVDASILGIAFAVAAGFFSGLVWVGSKLSDDSRASRIPDAIIPNIKTLEVETLYVYVNVKPECVRDFITATRASRDASRGESACFNYDIYQAAFDTTKFILHEVYQYPRGARVHKNSSHYETWNRTVAPMMACDRGRLNAMPLGYKLIV